MAKTTNPIERLLSELVLADSDEEGKLMSEQWLKDEIPILPSYPNFDLSFLKENKVASAINLIKISIEQILNSIAFQPNQALVTKSSGEHQKIFGRSIKSNESEWIIDLSGFTTSETMCRLEIALFCPGNSDAELSDISVMVSDPETSMSRKTDDSGIVEFLNIKRSQLHQLEVTVDLPG